VFSIKKKKKKEKLRSFHKIAFDIMKQASLCPSQSFITEVIANYLKRSSEQTKSSATEGDRKKMLVFTNLLLQPSALSPTRKAQGSKTFPSLFYKHKRLPYCIDRSHNWFSKALKLFPAPKKKKKNPTSSQEKTLLSADEERQQQRDTQKKKKLNKNSGEKALARSQAKHTRAQSLSFSLLSSGSVVGRR
jgi:hypothetical protein